MNTTNTLTGAELQTLREAAGLSRELFGALIGVEARTVKHWEIRKGAGVPADAAALARRLVNWVIEASEASARHSLDAIRENGTPGDVVLVRHRFKESLSDAERDQCLLAEVHGAMISRLALIMMAQAVPVRVVWFDPEGYAHWASEVQGLPAGHDTPGARAAWAAQAVERQAIPHPGDQPPAAHTPGR